MTQYDFTVANTIVKDNATRSSRRKVKKGRINHHHDLAVLLTIVVVPSMGWSW